MTGETTLKAARPSPGRGINPSGRMMRAMERDAEARIAWALDKMRRDLVRGLNEQNVHSLTSRLSSREILQPFTDTLVSVLRDIALAGSSFGQEQVERFVFGTRKRVETVAGIGIDWELANQAASDWALWHGRNLSGQLAKVTTSGIQKLISEWVLNGETINQLAQRINQSTYVSTERAKTIAITETTRAFAEGNRSSWRESGVVEKRRWNTANDELVCPICGPLHNAVTGIDESFPDGYQNPPAHPRCRCWITPVVEGAEERPVGLETF